MPEIHATAAVLVASDAAASGTRADESGPLAQRLLFELGLDCRPPVVVPDERDQIADALRRLADDGVDLIVTSGGTGFAPRDVTPEATRDVIEREAPGVAEAIRDGSPAPYGALTRGVAGLRGRTIIVNLPGSKGAVRDGIQILTGMLEHAIELAGGRSAPHPSPES